MFRLTNEQKDAAASGIKLTGAWGSVGITNLTEVTSWAHLVAEIGAATLTILLVLEFLVRKVILPFCRWRGWIKPKECAKDE